MSDQFTLADIDRPGTAGAGGRGPLDFELRYRDGTSSARETAHSLEVFDWEIGTIFDREIDLRLAQPRPPGCSDIDSVSRPEELWEVEDTWDDYDDECRCSGACFCYADPYAVVKPQRSNAIGALAGCTDPAIIATWRWQQDGNGGTDTIYTTGFARESFVELRGWFPSQEEREWLRSREDEDE